MLNHCLAQHFRQPIETRTAGLRILEAIPGDEASLTVYELSGKYVTHAAPDEIYRCQVEQVRLAFEQLSFTKKLSKEYLRKGLHRLYLLTTGLAFDMATPEHRGWVERAVKDRTWRDAFQEIQKLYVPYEIPTQDPGAAPGKDQEEEVDESASQRLRKVMLPENPPQAPEPGNQQVTGGDEPSTLRQSANAAPARDSPKAADSARDVSSPSQETDSS